MPNDRPYFPWHIFQLWLREGFFAGFVFNKLIVASWPKEKGRPITTRAASEEIELLRKILKWTENNGKECASLSRLCNTKPGDDYPDLPDDDVRSLWLVVTEYGVSNDTYGTLHARMQDYFVKAPNVDAAIKEGMDALWRSIGPALDPDRDNIERAAKVA